MNWINIKPKGDFYVWECEWCDSTNATIWMKVEADNLTCTACQRKYSLDGNGYPHLEDESMGNLLQAV